MSSIAIIDLDFVLYAASSVGEERYVEVVHTPSGRMKEFSNRTEFCGRNNRGGWLQEQNEKRIEKGLDSFTLEDFQIIQKHRVTEPVENVLHSAKTMVESALKASRADSYEAYLGYGESHRVSLAKMMKYKGNREDLLKPLLLDDVKEYLQKKFNAVRVEGIEVDDAVVIRCVDLLNQGKDAFVIAVDKDAMGCPIKVYNPNKQEDGVVDCRGFGRLYLDDKKKVRGYGQLWKYFQICVGDPVDCYKANNLSGVRWGEKSAYKALKDCQDDQQAWKAMVDIFKKLYPEPVTFDSWDGNTYTYSWLDAMQEMADCAHMLEFEGDRLVVEDCLDRWGIPYSK